MLIKTTPNPTNMKKMLHINHLVYERPLLITRSGFHTIDRLLKKRAEQDPMDPEDMPEDGMPEDEYDMEIEEGVAYIHINGPIGKNLDMLSKICGACDIATVKEEIDLALSYPDCEMICFLVNSPGGSVDGVPELAEYIAEISKEKPTVAVVEGMCCSAAYYLVAGVSEGIYAIGKTSYIGSIGVYAYLLDESRAYEKEGLKPVLVKAGENKGQGLPGFPIDQKMIDGLQKEIDYIYGLFRGHVAKCKPKVEDSTCQGDAYYAEEAYDLNLIDGIVSNISELFINKYEA